MTPSTAPTARDVLAAAREIVAAPDAWNPRNRAVDAAGIPVHPADPAACAFSTPGAIDAAVCRLFDTRDYAAQPAWNEALDAIDATVASLTDCYHRRLATYDRDSDRDAVLHALDIAISDLPR
ncbi:MAG: hypothetical protein OYH76_01130 [Defluviicoccus sp.]|nr:hypothetical protein [Defluviicoccus sp.]MDE0274466.1 hypothetical protein [Defluviicoccus sp.]